MPGQGEVESVHFVVVVVAEQGAVVDGGDSAVALPPCQVVDVAPAGVGVAVGPGAFAVAGDDGFALRTGEQPLGAPQANGTPLELMTIRVSSQSRITTPSSLEGTGVPSSNVAGA